MGGFRQATLAPPKLSSRLIRCLKQDFCAYLATVVFGTAFGDAVL
jgi:hypothetical protein